MRIGINLLYLLPGRVGGTETYAAGLLEGLSRVRPAGKEFTVYLNEEARDWPFPAGPFERVVCPVRAASRARRYAFEQLSLPKLLARDRVDLVHSLGYVGPLRAPCPAVLTVPDLNYRAFGDEMPFVRRTALAFFVRESVRRADRLITISDFARGQIADAFARRRDEIAVTHLAPRPRTIPPPLPRKPGDRPYLLAFSSDSPNKNIGRLLEAFERARAAGATEHELVLVGHPPPGLSRRLASGEPAGVRALGYLAEDELARVLAAADFLVFPSLYEGFGLPVLEAMEAGVPVACSRRASLPEVAGDAALFFDPESAGDIAAAIGRLSRDAALRVDLRRRGTANLARFSWEKTARETLAVYDSIPPSRGYTRGT